MYTAKYVVPSLFLSLLSFMGFQGIQNNQPSSSREFVAEITQAELMDYFAKSIESLDKVEKIQLYQTADQLIYELSGRTASGEVQSQEAKVDKTLLSKEFDYNMNPPCGCAHVGMAWQSGAVYECAGSCEGEKK
ncbi:MAG: hypothetical protein AAFV95_20010 [Bacteroidota bacterium]